MKLYSWGPNSCGQLGQGTTAEECRQPIQVPSDFFDDILSINGGGNHSFILLENGTLFYCGKDEAIFNGSIVTSFHQILHDMNISKVESMWDSFVVLNKDGDCYGWGSNVYGQLGIKEKKTVDLKLLTDYKIKDIAVGLRHCLILRQDGVVLSAGNGKCGQLGREDNEGFHPVERLPKVEKICCGMNHSLCITEDGRLFSWGSNKFSQLGLDPDFYPSSRFPEEIKLPISPSELLSSKLLSGWTHSAILTANGELINWGRNNYGQLGDNSENSRWIPKILPNQKFNDVAIGAEHNLGLVGNSLYTWGWNEHGSCGNDKENVTEPTLIQLKNVIKIGVGASQSYAICNFN